jgi:hypothetical protein
MFILFRFLYIVWVWAALPDISEVRIAPPPHPYGRCRYSEYGVLTSLWFFLLHLHLH